MLKAAADLGVPVFVHPQTDPQLHKRFSRTGRIGLRLARGTINNAALINMLESGAFDEAPKLQLVVTTLALGGLMLAGGFGDGARIRSDAPALTRRHVYVDTMGINPVDGPRRGRPARRRPCADGHRLADRRGKIGARAAREGARAFRAERRRAADGRGRQRAAAARRGLGSD